VGIIAYRAMYFGCYDAGKMILFKDEKNTSIIIKFLYAMVNRDFNIDYKIIKDYSALKYISHHNITLII
jgi:hypothetical protein